MTPKPEAPVIHPRERKRPCDTCGRRIAAWRLDDHEAECIPGWDNPADSDDMWPLDVA